MGAGDFLNSARLAAEDAVWKVKKRLQIPFRGKIKNYIFFTAGIIVISGAAALVTAIIAARPVTPPQVEAAIEKIPPEEFFLPGEPEFLPPVIFSRQRNPVWTADTASPFWADPAGLVEEQWGKDVGKYVDSLLESIP